jgi:hypothetical protein
LYTLYYTIVKYKLLKEVINLGRRME